jgi:hypothetical protein
MLKPPQAAPILLLMGIWLVARKDWRTIQGMIVGGIILWLIGASVDIHWVTKFLDSGEAAFDRKLGLHSNVWSYAYLLCGRESTVCTYALGGLAALMLLGLAGFYLWKYQARLGAWEALNLVIPIGFVSTVYLWGYDQILYIIPILWVVGTLVQKTKSYIHAFLFLIPLVMYAFFAMARLGVTSKDLWSFGNTLIVLLGLWIAAIMKEKPAKQKSIQP